MRRHCERSEAIQTARPGRPDCFFASLLAMTICGSTDAGGEDFGYFAPGKAGSNPAFDSRTEERPWQGTARASARILIRKDEELR